MLKYRDQSLIREKNDLSILIKIMMGILQLMRPQQGHLKAVGRSATDGQGKPFQGRAILLLFMTEIFSKIPLDNNSTPWHYSFYSNDLRILSSVPSSIIDLRAFSNIGITRHIWHAYKETIGFRPTRRLPVFRSD